MGERVVRCYAGGKPIARGKYDIGTYHKWLDSANNKDCQYMDYETRWMYWDEEENEIGKLNGEFQRSYGHDTYFPDIVNDYSDQAETGAHYPGHRYSS